MHHHSAPNIERLIQGAALAVSGGMFGARSHIGSCVPHLGDVLRANKPLIYRLL
jgi:hypothetical protein